MLDNNDSVWGQDVVTAGRGQFTGGFTVTTSN